MATIDDGEVVAIFQYACVVEIAGIFASGEARRDNALGGRSRIWCCRGHGCGKSGKDDGEGQHFEGLVCVMKVTDRLALGNKLGRDLRMLG